MTSGFSSRTKTRSSMVGSAARRLATNGTYASDVPHQSSVMTMTLRGRPSRSSMPASMDSAAKNTFEGAPAGVGATLAWSGNAQIGEGRMTIIESRPDEIIRIRLDFARPFASTSFADFTFTPEGGRTAVTWSMTGHKNFVAKAIGLVMSIDRMIGGPLE